MFLQSNHIIANLFLQRNTYFCNKIKPFLMGRNILECKNVIAIVSKLLLLRMYCTPPTIRMTCNEQRGSSGCPGDTLMSKTYEDKQAGNYKNYP